MTRIFNDPSDFAEEALAGFCDLHSDLVRQVPGGAVRRRRSATPKVAVLAGGGSGHYPAFAGLIGAGLADGAVVGNIFTSPSAQQAYSVAKSAENGAGVVFAYGNYAGDVMNFGMASERLAAEGIAVENVLVTDDIASAPPSESGKRRGIAGDFTVFKVMGAAAEAGANLADVVRLGRKANELTRSIGSAFHGCTFPGAEAPLFTLEDRKMGLGLGIHGEPGLFDTELPPARELGQELVSRVLAETPHGAGRRIAVILNGLGSTKHEELFVLWLTVAPLLRAAGYTLVMPEVGELVTSLDMAGVSLTVTWLDEELEPLWTAPAETPAYRRGAAAPLAGDSSDERRPTTPQVLKLMRPGKARGRMRATALPRSVPPAKRCTTPSSGWATSMPLPGTATTGGEWSAGSMRPPPPPWRPWPGAPVPVTCWPRQVTPGPTRPAARRGCCGVPDCGPSASPSATITPPMSMSSPPRSSPLRPGSLSLARPRPVTRPWWTRWSRSRKRSGGRRRGRARPGCSGRRRPRRPPRRRKPPPPCDRARDAPVRSRKRA